MQLYDQSWKRLTIVQVAPDYYPVPPPAYGGIERVVYTLTEQLVRLGHNVILYAPQGSITVAKLIPYTHAAGNPHTIQETVVRTLPDHIDIIHDHTHSSIIGRLKLPVPTVCTLHAAVNNHIEHPVYLSQSSLTSAGSNTGDVIYNGIDPDEFDFTEEKSDYLLYLGVISPHKGVHHALHIAEITGQKLVLAGPVFNWDYFHSDIEPILQRNPNLSYVGEVGGEDKRRLLKEARCMLFPTCCEEAFGLVMVEAMVSGTPVLALANGAVHEVMSGFPQLVCHTVEEMIEKVKNGRFPDSATLRAYVLNRFTHEEMARQYLQLYRRLLEQSKWSASGIRQWKELQRDDLALQWCDGILRQETASVDEKLLACSEAADLYHGRGELEKEKAYIYRSFEIAAPRAEFCCRLGYLHLQQNDYAKAAYWFRLATQIEPPPVDRRSFYNESCWTWLPHVQLCICSYHLGDLEAAYHHNELARSYNPEEPHVLHNKSFLESLLYPSPPQPENRLQVELDGATGSPFRMALCLPGFIEETIRDRRAWEPELARLLSRYMESGGIFVDIGANIGYHTLYMATLGEAVHCVGFEPHPDIYRQLAENVELNGFSNISVVDVAIGDKCGEITFYKQKTTSYNRGLSGTILASDGEDDFVCSEVLMKTMDEALTSAQKQQTRVIKIDTQGFEYEVLQGAMETIRLSQPVIAFEYHTYGSHPLHEILGLLPGYEIYKLQIWTGEIRQLNEADPVGFEQDYICVPAHYSKKPTKQG